jgi:hypothetical protein
MSTSAQSQLNAGRSRDDSRTVAAIAVWSAITLVAAVLVSRRLAGAFSSEAAAVTTCVAGTAALLLSLAANALWCASNPTASGRKQAIAAALTILPPLALCAALWMSFSAFIGGYLSALFVLSALATVFIRDLVPGALRNSDSYAFENRLVEPRLQSTVEVQNGSEAVASTVSRPLDTQANLSEPLGMDEPGDEEAIEGDPSILQWMTRKLLAGGGESVDGSVRIYFAPGERSAMAHISFIPPLSDRPHAECQLLVDFNGRVRIGVALAYGLRIEARRPEPATQAISIDVGFSAQVRAVQRVAA